MLIAGSDPVRKISIIPRGRALGVTFQSPDADRYGYSADYLRGRLIGALGGRAAEQIIYDDQTTGAESDLEQATRLARLMIGRWGMSQGIGPVTVLSGPNDEPRLFPGGVDAGLRAHPRTGRPAKFAASSTSARQLQSRRSQSTATNSTPWPTHCSRMKPWTRQTPTGSPASRANPTAARMPRFRWRRRNIRRR